MTVEQRRSSSRALQGPPNPIRRDGQARSSSPSPSSCSPRPPPSSRVGREQVPLEVGRYSDWVEVAFPMGLGLKLRGICRFRLLEVHPQFRLYVSPINIDPAKPVMPISHPFIFSVFLAKLCGPLLHAGPGRGHLGPQRGGPRRGRLPGAGLGQPHRARGHVLRDVAPDPQGAGQLRVRRHRPHPAHVHALPGPGPPRRRRPLHGRALRVGHRRHLRPHGRPHRPGHGRGERQRPPHPADGAVGPRLQDLPPGGQPQLLALPARLPGAQPGLAGVGRVVPGRRLVAHARLRAGPGGHLPQRPRARVDGHGEPGQGGQRPGR